MSEKFRPSFERWASAPPREWDIRRNPDSPKASWPGQYKSYSTQCAWESWAHVCEKASQIKTLGA